MINHNNDNNSSCNQRRNWRFFTIFSVCHELPRELSPTCMLKRPGHNNVQITCDTLSAYLVQYVMLRVTWYEGTAPLLRLTEFKSHLLSSFLLAEPLTDEGGEETGVPGKKNRWQ